MREPLHHVVPAVPTAGFTLPAERFSRSQPNPALARRPALPSIVLQCCAAPLHCTRRRHTPGRGSTRAPPRLKFMLLDVNVSPGSCQKQKIGSHARCGPGATALPRSPPLLLTSRPVGAIGGGGGGIHSRFRRVEPWAQAPGRFRGLGSAAAPVSCVVLRRRSGRPVVLRPRPRRGVGIGRQPAEGCPGPAHGACV